MRGLVALIALLAWGLQASLLQGLSVAAPAPERLRVPRPAVVHLLKTDFDNLVADGYWIAVLLHNGTQLQQEDEGQRDFSGMYEALDLIGQLDPRFGLAGTLGGWMLADARHLDQARTLLRRRMAASPGAWEFPYHLAFVEFLYGDRYLEAAELFMQASRLADCPKGAVRMAASLYAKGNKRDLSIATWRQIYARGDESTRGMARRALARVGIQVP